MAFDASENQRCRADFPSLSRTHADGQPFVYLDGPAGSQVPRQVISAISRYYETCNANSHGAFATSVESDATIAGAREACAALLGARSAKEISFGQNMTTLAFGLSRAFSRVFREGDEIVITELDHEGNRGPWLTLAERGVVIREARLKRDGTLDLDDMRSKISARTRLVAVGGASNALGTVNDLAAARELSRAASAWLLVDAVHLAPHFSIDAQAIDADVLLCSAYKFYGPHIGVLYARPGLLDELRVDRLRTAPSAAPEKIETGTLNHAAIAGVKAAIHYLASWGRGADLRAQLVSAMRDIAAWERSVGAYYYENVQSIPGVTVWGPDFTPAQRAPTISLTIDSMPADKAAEALAARGIAVWSGDFYARRAVEVLGLAERGGLLRTGILMYNTREEVDRLIEGLREITKR